MLHQLKFEAATSSRKDGRLTTRGLLLLLLLILFVDLMKAALFNIPSALL